MAMVRLATKLLVFCTTTGPVEDQHGGFLSDSDRMMIKALFQNRPDAFSNRGGDTVQMHYTQLHLQKLGLKVEVSLEAEPDLAGYDLVHIFNIQTSLHGIRQCRNAARQGLAIALSTIFWDLEPTRTDIYRLFYGPSAMVGRLARAAPTLVGAAWRLRYGLEDRRWRATALPMLQLADILLPNSHAEIEALVHHFSAPWIRCKSSVVPNAVNTSESPLLTASLPEIFGEIPAPYVLQVGRVQPVKNQLRLIQALASDPNIPLVLVGKPVHQNYAAACRKAAARRGNTWFIDELPHDSLSVIYQHAKVHVLPSLGETTGLVTLEAAHFGVNCVVSHHGPVSEYFGKLAWCCDPLELSSIRNAVLSAWQAPPQTALGCRVREELTWEKAAEKTLAAYRSLGLG